MEFLGINKGKTTNFKEDDLCLRGRGDLLV